jgi:hypothetical protein
MKIWSAFWTARRIVGFLTIKEHTQDLEELDVRQISALLPAMDFQVTFTVIGYQTSPADSCQAGSCCVWVQESMG